MDGVASDWRHRGKLFMIFACIDHDELTPPPAQQQNTNSSLNIASPLRLRPAPNRQFNRSSSSSFVSFKRRYTFTGFMVIHNTRQGLLIPTTRTRLNPSVTPLKRTWNHRTASCATRRCWHSRSGNAGSSGWRSGVPGRGTEVMRGGWSEGNSRIPRRGRC